MNNDARLADLPPWFIRPSPVTERQPSLFHIHLEDALVRLQISADELARWHRNGWTSFDSSTCLEFDEFGDPKSWELIFVRDIVRSGVSDAQIEALFAQVERPFAFNPDRVAFNFRHGWVEVAENDPPVPDKDTREPYEIIEEHIDDWAADSDEETRRRLLKQTTEALESFSNNGQENRA